MTRRETLGPCSTSSVAGSGGRRVVRRVRYADSGGALLPPFAVPCGRGVDVRTGSGTYDTAVDGSPTSIGWDQSAGVGSDATGAKRRHTARPSICVLQNIGWAAAPGNPHV